MKTNRIFFVIFIFALSMFSIREANSFPCDGVNPPYCECEGWTTNDQWGSSIVIPTGDPTCYYTVEYNIRRCQCGTAYWKYQFKILGITKYGDCTGKTDGEIFTEVYSFILLIAKDLFEIPLNVFEIDIIAPACYQWVGDELQGCAGSACCHKTWVVTYNPETKSTEIASYATQNEVCGIVYNCPNLCDALNLSDGTLNYPAWPSNCAEQDPCPNVPWNFDPAWNKVFGVMLPPQDAPFVAFYETKVCNGDTLFRVKFVQMAYTNYIPTQDILAKAVRRILNEIYYPGEGQNGRFNRYLLSYSCWTNIAGYYSQRIVPCLDVDECCYIHYRTDGSAGSRSLMSPRELLSSGNPNCSTNCTYVCEDLVTDRLMPLGLLPGRQGKIPVPEETKPIDVGSNPENITVDIVRNELLIKFDYPTSENVQISIFNILGEKVYDGTINGGNRSEIKVDITNYARGSYSFVLRLNEQTFFRTFLKY